MKHPPTTKRGQATRNRLLQAAWKIVRERGVAAASLDAIEAAAGVGRSQLYHYFEDRDDLLRSVATTAVDTVLAQSEALLSNLKSLEDIDDWFARILAINTRTGGIGGCPIGSLINQVGEQDEKSRRLLAEAFTRWEKALSTGFARMKSSGVIRTGVSADDLASFVMAALQGGLLLAQVHRDPNQLRRALAGARIVLVNSLISPKGAAK